MDILVICTGNLCRSPLAAAMLDDRLRAAGVTATVRSAGLLGSGAMPPAELLEVASSRGLDLSDHRSRRLYAQEVAEAELVLGMTREHVREAVLACPPCWPRSFTLKELVRRGGDTGGRRADETLAVWIDRVHQGRQRTELLGSSDVDDVEDPMGRSPGAYEDTATELAGLLDALVSLAWPAGAPA